MSIERTQKLLARMNPQTTWRDGIASRGQDTLHSDDIARAASYVKNKLARALVYAIAMPTPMAYAEALHELLPVVQREAGGIDRRTAINMAAAIIREIEQPQKCRHCMGSGIDYTTDGQQITCGKCGGSANRASLRWRIKQCRVGFPRWRKIADVYARVKLIADDAHKHGLRITDRALRHEN